METKETKKKRKKKTKMAIADDLFAEYIRNRDRFCLYGQLTGEPCSGALQCSHIISKGACSELRYDPNNAIALCYKHHIHGWHGLNSALFADWFIKTYPKRWEYVSKAFADYKLRSGTKDGFRPSKEYYSEIIDHYKELIEKDFTISYN